MLLLNPLIGVKTKSVLSSEHNPRIARVRWNEIKRLWNSRKACLFPFINLHIPRYFAENDIFFFHLFGVRPLIESIFAMLLFQLREYTLTESYHEDEVEVEFVSNDNLQANSETPRGIDPNRDLNEAIAEERREMDTQRYRYTFFTFQPLSLRPETFTLFFYKYGNGKSHFLPHIWQVDFKIKQQFFFSFLHTFILDLVNRFFSNLGRPIKSIEKF